MDAAWQDAMSSVLALGIGGISAMLGLWVGRDKTRPVSFAVAMTVLIGSAVTVGIVQSVLDAEEAIQKQADLDRMIDTVAEIAMASGDAELASLIEAQSGRKVELPAPLPEPEPAQGDTGAAAATGAVADEALAAPADAAAPTDGAAAPAPQ